MLYVPITETVSSLYRIRDAARDGDRVGELWFAAVQKATDCLLYLNYKAIVFRTSNQRKMLSQAICPSWIAFLKNTAMRPTQHSLMLLSKPRPLHGQAQSIRSSLNPEADGEHG